MNIVIETSLEFVDKSSVHFGQEPNGSLISYYALGETLDNEIVEAVSEDFKGMTFVEEAQRITLQRVKDFGIKTFPHFGALGFFTPKYGTSSVIEAPINRAYERSTAPEVVVTDTGTTIHLVITSSMEYECYRIVVRNGDFATEFITYDETFDFTPMYTGSCDILVIGHSDEISVTSEPYRKTMALVDRT